MSLVSVAISRASSGGFDKMVAALAAAAAAVAVFILPADVLDRLVLAGGMADMFAPLQPPLGLRAKLGLALLSAGSAFGMVLLLMKVLGRIPGRREEDVEADAAAMPRVRRRDRHPDAPARPPLSVSRDLGEPEFAPEPKATPKAMPKPTPKPEPQPEFEPLPLPRARPRTLDTRRRAPLIEVLSGMADEEEARKEVPVHSDPAPTEEPVQANLSAEDQLDPFWAETAPAPLPELELAAEAEPEPEPEPDYEPEAVDVQPRPAAAPSNVWTGQETLTELLERLERALERKQEAQGAAAPAAAAGRDGEPEDGTEVRLRSALENLRRFAPRAG